jgi:probable rRNA maturation factor
MSGISLQIDFRQEDMAWDAVADAHALLEKSLRAAWLDADGGGGQAEVSVLLADDDTLQALNRDWRGKDNPTNVLSFPAPEIALPGAGSPQPRHLGDIAMSYQTLAREAERDGKSLGHHLQHLAIHGMLHLQGYDHETDDEAEEMEALERRLLAELGVPDPYAD